MAEELDAWRVAHQLVTAKGDDAHAHVARFAEFCTQNGAFDGVAFWRRIATALAELRSTTVPRKPNRRQGRQRSCSISVLIMASVAP